MSGLRIDRGLAFAIVLALLLPGAALAHDPPFTIDFDRDRCTFTSAGTNPYFPLWPGYGLRLEGIDEDEGEMIEIAVLQTVLAETERVDGVVTRVVEEREWEDGELVEVSRNFMAICRETGDVWYFGEEVDDYEDGEIVGHGGAWRAGSNGALPGIIMLGTPVIGARYNQELAPGVAEDRGEVWALNQPVDTPLGTFTETLTTLDTNALDPEAEDVKSYAYGVGLVVDEVLELVEIIPPSCQPDDTTHCLNNGRFQVEAEWMTADGTTGDGVAILPSSDSGEFWFFSPQNTELLVKVLDACNTEFHSFWVFAAGLTNVEVTIRVIDTLTSQSREFGNALGTEFEPVLDTEAFLTCDSMSGDDEGGDDGE